MIGITGASVATLDVAACTRHGILVSNTAGGGSGAPYATAELALGLLIAAARSIPVADATIRAGGFQRGVPVGVSLAGKTLGMVGLGRLGTRLARYAAALEMKVIAWSPNLAEDRARDAGARLVGKSEIMAESDAISIHMVLSPRSRGIVGAEDIGRMKNGAILINTSRGPLIDEPALVAAVNAGKDHCGARCIRQRAFARGSSLARVEACRAYAASWLRGRGNLARFLPAKH
jgi:phosphoglycerate dehydrogenase-like enzyme